MITKTVYRRHIFELVEELSDAIFWTLILCLLFIPAGVLFDYQRIWALVLFSGFPIAKLFIEILNWWNEVYTIESSADSDSLRKEWGILEKNEIVEQLKSNVHIVKKQPLYMRVIGVCRATVRSSSNAYIEGRLVPFAFYQELDRIISGHRKQATELTGNTIMDMIRMGPSLVEAGLADRTIVQDFIANAYGMMWGEA